jgi:hypothetical protein
MRGFIGFIGERIIYLLIALFGRRRTDADDPWLVGPVGGPMIGDRPYEETAEREDLEIVRNAKESGLIPDFDALKSPSFDPARVHPKIRDFYEQTHKYRLDTWATTYFPARLALWLLVTTISRRVNQLNFPIDGLGTAAGMTSEILLLKRRDGSIRYTGWFRRLKPDNRVIYTGFYMTEKPPATDGPCVKVVFPMPDGNATVVLKPGHFEETGFTLSSRGSAWGDAGFYRVQKSGSEAKRIWRITTLHETFRLWLDEEDLVRCEHAIRFLGFRVLTLHYRMSTAVAS